MPETVTIFVERSGSVSGNRYARSMRFDSEELDRRRQPLGELMAATILKMRKQLDEREEQDRKHVVDTPVSKA